MKERTVKTETVLGSGRKIKVFKGTARDMVSAQSMCKRPEEAQLALASLLIEVDGKMMPFEDWGDMDLDDYIEIAPFLFSSPETSPAS